MTSMISNFSMITDFYLLSTVKRVDSEMVFLLFVALAEVVLVFSYIKGPLSRPAHACAVNRN